MNLIKKAFHIPIPKATVGITAIITAVKSPIKRKFHFFLKKQNNDVNCTDKSRQCYLYNSINYLNNMLNNLNTYSEIFLCLDNNCINKYIYDNVNYINSHTKVKIICPVHGEFEQMPYDHVSKHGCVKCSSSISTDEKLINNFLIENGLTTVTSSKSIISPNQIDIFVPSHNLAIEYNGLYWHNETKVNDDYHLNKTELCEKKGIRLIHIFEDEWVNKPYIFKSRLINILGLTKNKIYARKCIIKELKIFYLNLKHHVIIAIHFIPNILKN